MTIPITTNFIFTILSEKVITNENYKLEVWWKISRKISKNYSIESRYFKNVKILKQQNKKIYNMGKKISMDWER